MPFRSFPLPPGAVAGLLALLLSGLSGCGETGGGPPSEEPRIVASIFPVADLARRIGGSSVRVEVLLPRGASPATFEITPRTLREVEGAGVFVLVGGGLDPWAAEVVRSAPGARTVILLEDLDLRGEGVEAETGNPHVWLDPVRTRDELLPRITEALSLAAPAARARFEGRARALADTLTALDREIRASLSSLERRSFVASHSAWVYFAERYGLDQVGVVHRHPGRDPSARSLAGLVERARRSGVPVVFGEPQVPDAAARALGVELGVPVLPLDPLGAPGLEGRDSYTALMRYNTAQFVRGLGGGEPPSRSDGESTVPTGEVATFP